MNTKNFIFGFEVYTIKIVFATLLKVNKNTTNLPKNFSF